MARQEQKRENLLLEATALVRRMLIEIAPIYFRQAAVTELVAGQRRAGEWSLYFGESPVLQFDLRGHLRRLHVYPEKYSAQSGQLNRMIRCGASGRVQFELQPLVESEQQQLLAELSLLLTDTYHGLNSQPPRSRLLGSKPEGDERLLVELTEFLRTSVQQPLIVSQAPSAST